MHSGSMGSWRLHEPELPGQEQMLMRRGKVALESLRDVLVMRSLRWYEYSGLIVSAATEVAERATFSRPLRARLQLSVFEGSVIQR